MNEFLEQFLIEARELVQQSTDDLLALEQAPGDRERLDSAFRAFHTLKGAAGIVDFDAMSVAMHAAEDVLAAVRSGADRMSPELVGACLSCIDLVVQWLDFMEQSGAPPADARHAAEAAVVRLRQIGTRSAEPPIASDAAGDWLPALTSRFPEAAGMAASALRLSPEADAFFRGQDPLADVAALPGLLALHLGPNGDWPPLEAFDPFDCQLVLTALTSSPADEISGLLAAWADRVHVRPLPSGALAESSGLAPEARALLEAQVLLLSEAIEDGFTGRVGSAARVAANVLLQSGMASLAAQTERTLAMCLSARDAGLLAVALQRILDGEADVEVGDAATDEPGPRREGRDAAIRVLRVDVGRVDALVKLAGELTVAKNALAHAAELAERDTDAQALAVMLKNQHAVLDRLVLQLQQSVLNLRVLPLREVFQRFPRLVRDMATGLGKPVTLVLQGESTEADKVIVEALFEPLLHVLRNAVDHGIEQASARSAAGKPASAVITLRAERRGEHVLIEVEDDGRGVDVERVRRTAAERGMGGVETLASLSDSEVVDLIFEPGFSTAAGVTALSGRGVGMDAVRTSLTQLGGRVEVESRAGKGATVRFTLPFTVIMSRVVTVEAGGQAFGIPLDALVETLRVPRDRILPLGAGAAFVLRERTVPLIDLGESLGSNRAEPSAGAAMVVVAAVSGQWAGLEVDRVGERMDVMLKPMEGLLSGMPGVAGTTLLGDGRVLIVLDLEELVAWR